MDLHPLRLSAGEDLRGALQALLASLHSEAAFVLQGIGSLSQAQLRLAGRESADLIQGDLEILTLAGSISPDGAHLHMGIADAEGHVLGGHVAAGCIVRTTAEILVAVLPKHHFQRRLDPATGHAELVVTPKSS